MTAPNGEPWADFGTDKWVEQANEQLNSVKGCPQCKEIGTATVARKLVPTGGSLAGQQLKFSVRYEIVLECSACGVTGRLTADD